MLPDHHLPLLLRAAGDVSADFARLRSLPLARAVGVISTDKRP